MSDQAVTILVSLFAALGGGGIGAAVIAAIANRKKVDAEATMTLAEGYELRLAKLTERTCQLETRIDTLEALVSTLRTTLSERDTLIDTLKHENAELKKQVEVLQAENACKEKQIERLQNRMRHLEKLVADMGLPISDGNTES